MSTKKKTKGTEKPVYARFDQYKTLYEFVMFLHERMDKSDSKFEYFRNNTLKEIDTMKTLPKHDPEVSKILLARTVDLREDLEGLRDRVNAHTLKPTRWQRIKNWFNHQILGG